MSFLFEINRITRTKEKYRKGRRLKFCGTTLGEEWKTFRPVPTWSPAGVLVRLTVGAVPDPLSTAVVRDGELIISDTVPILE